MIKKSWSGLLCCIFFLPLVLDAETNNEYDQAAAEIVSGLSDQEIIAQTLMVGWVGIDPSDELLQWLETHSIGGIKVFGWNGTDAARLKKSLARMQNIAQERIPGLPLLVATDQEGGLVRHIKDNTVVTPGNFAVGATNMAHEAYLTGYYINKELADIGITMNFSPTVDVLVEKNSIIIGSRAFSSDHETTALLGTAYMSGSLDAGVIPTAKHFPGHGNTSVDSHGALPIIQDDYATLWKRDFYPYRMMIPSGLPAILIGHLNFPNITQNDIPSSLSSFFIKDVLRQELNFDGLVITDDLYMGAIYTHARKNDWSTGTLVLEAIRVGNDMILLSRTPSLRGEIMRTLMDAYAEDPTMRERFREAAHRVIKTKLLHARIIAQAKDVPNTTTAQHHADPRTFFFQNALRSVTVIRKSETRPTINPHADMLVVSNDFDFIRAARVKLPNTRIISYRSDTELSLVKQQIDRYSREDTIIVLSVINDASYALLNQLTSYKDRLYVVAALNPYRLVQTQWVENAIAVYGWGFESYLGGLSVLIGEIPAYGRLPID